MPADDFARDLETGSSSKGDPKAPATNAGAITLRKAILDAWRDLLRSRENLLIRYYTSSIGPAGEDLIPPETLDEVRRRFYSAKGAPQESDSVRSTLESKFVLGTRIIAAWVVFWTTIAPAVPIALLCVNLIFRAPRTTPLSSRLVLASIATLILFPVLSVAGLALQSLFLRPFSFLVNNLLTIPNDESIRPKETEIPPQSDPAAEANPDE